jgi:hypothetical protein
MLFKEEPSASELAAEVDDSDVVFISRDIYGAFGVVYL